MASSEVITHERVGRVVAGVSLLASVALGFFHHPAWLLVTSGTALNLVVSGLTGRCPVKSLLLRIGIPGERDVGRAEAQREAAAEQLRNFAGPVNRVAAREKAAIN